MQETEKSFWKRDWTRPSLSYWERRELILSPAKVPSNASNRSFMAEVLHHNGRENQWPNKAIIEIYSNFYILFLDITTSLEIAIYLIYALTRQ